MSKAFLIIDAQNDFVNPDDHVDVPGSLTVPGAEAACVRIADFISRENLDTLVLTQDSHYDYHIGHPLYWRIRGTLSPVEPFTTIRSTQVESGEIVAANSLAYEWTLTYLRKLEAKNKTHMVWPYHCVIGTPGHNINPTILEAVRDWEHEHLKTAARIMKGQTAHNEMYSIVSPEVQIPTGPTQAEIQTCSELDIALYGQKVVYVAGFALSHCVVSSLRDLTTKYTSTQFVLLTNGTSSVKGFEEYAETAVKELVAAGMGLDTI